MMRLQYVIILLFAASLADLGAQERVVQLFASPAPDRQLESVFYLAIGVELTRLGLSTGRVTEPGATVPASSEPGELFRRAVERQWEYILLVRYEMENGNSGSARVVLTLFREDFGTSLATVRLEAPLDIELDLRVAVALRRLVLQAGINRVPTGEEFIEGVTPVFDRPPETVEPAPEIREVLRDAEPVAAAVAGFEYSVLMSGIVLLGDATEFFRYGMGGVVNVGYARQRDTFSATIGARLALMRVFTDSGISGGDLYITTLGPDIHVGTSVRAPSRVGARLCGGAALITVNARDETLRKIVPYLDVGFNARIPLGARLSFGGELSLLSVFEKEFPLVGISPAVMLTLEQ